MHPLHRAHYTLAAERLRQQRQKREMITAALTIAGIALVVLMLL